MTELDDKSEINDLKIDLDYDTEKSLKGSMEIINELITELGNHVLSQEMIDFQNSINEIIQSIFKNNLGFILDSFKEKIDAFWESIYGTIRNITSPDLSQEKKQKLIESHKKWGTFGWTINPCSEIDSLFDFCPEEKVEADKLAMKECRAKMDSIIEKIRCKKRAKKFDFDEAVDNFNKRNYKSCALILFSLIDSILIRFQGRSVSGKQRPNGKYALENIKNKTGYDEAEITLFAGMFYANLFSCIEKMFEKGNDFRTQPDVINRNFLCHGMMTRRVSKKDCIQLFLLYYNILEMLDMYYLD